MPIRQAVARLTALASLGAVLLLPPAPARAWGEDGHRIVCEIAYQEMAPATRARVGAWLRIPPDARGNLRLDESEYGAPGRTFFDGCNWPDSVRGSGEHHHWRDDTVRHYMNARGDGRELDAPGTAKELDPAADCGERCVTEAIRKYADLLRGKQQDPSRPAWAAIRFLGHFVGDLHQPLHVGYGADRGGNLFYVREHGQRCWPRGKRCEEDDRRQLHHAWDRSIPEQILQARGLDWRAYAYELHASTHPATGSLDPDRWAVESFEIARSEVYDLDEGDEVLSGPYYERAARRVPEQLLLAGLRLAALLDAIAAGDPLPWDPA